MNRTVDPAKRNEQILIELLKIETNKYCADCNQKGTRWASWNIGIFLCIRCGGLHRSLGTHISKVKSVTLDKWTDEQVESIKSKGNAKVNMIYNPNSDKHPFPSFSGDMENYIRDKYERKLFMVEGSSGSLGPMSLKHSGEKGKNNIMDTEFSFESSTNEFKSSSSENHGSNYSKQLTLLSEMGFTDSEFNHKILKAANGNMQEALEIIVATNQKQKRKTSEKNIFDDLEEAKPVAEVVQKSSDQSAYKSLPPMHMDDWGFSSEPAAPAVFKEEKIEITRPSEPEIVVEEVKPKKANKQASHNPWDSEFVEEASNSDHEPVKKSEDPFDSYKAFKSTPSDTYFDNPW